jgi:hypothetical protein
MLPLHHYYVPLVPVRVHGDVRAGTPPLPMTVVHRSTLRLIRDCQNMVLVRKLNIHKENVLLCSLLERA